MQLTKEERETIITFNEAEKEAEVHTYNRAMQKKLKQLHQQHPAEFIFIKGDEDCQVYRFPKRLVSIRGIRNLSKKQKEEAAERLEKAREAKTQPRFARKDRENNGKQ